MMAQGHTQTGIVAIEEPGYLEIGLCRTEAAVARHDDHIGRIAHVDGTHHRDAVDDAAVEHRYAVDIGNTRHVRQRRRRLNNGRQPAGIVLLSEIAGAAGETVGGHHLERSGILPIRLVVEGDYLVGETLIEDVGVEDAALGEETLQRDIAVLTEHVDVRIAGATRLAAHIAQSVAGTCRHGDDVWEVEVVLHKGVEHARGEHPAHASALEHQSGFST